MLILYINWYTSSFINHFRINFLLKKRSQIFNPWINFYLYHKDIEYLKENFDIKLDKVESSLKADIEKVETNLKANIKEFNNKTNTVKNEIKKDIFYISG